MLIVNRELLREFLRGLPWILGLWLLVLILPAAYLVITGEMTVGEAVGAGVTFMPLVVSLSPVIWLRYSRHRFRPKSFKVIGLALGWFVVTLPLAILLGMWLAHLFGLD